MAGYKEPGLQDRLGAAKKAKLAALAKLKAKPAIDPAERAARIAAAQKKEAERQVKIKAKKEAREAAAAEKIAAAKAEAQAIIDREEQAEADKKAARDLRYAERKARKKSR